MKKDSVQTATYTVLEPNTYLVVTADESRLMDYCVQMNERNRIPGLLDVHQQIMDGENRLYYDVTGKKRLTGVLGNQKLTRAQGEHLFRSLFSLFHLLPEYFLRTGMCLFDLEYLFVDDHFNAYLPLLPLESDGGSVDQELREFFLSLLGECCVGQQQDPYFDRMVKYLIQPNFSLEKMEELALPKTGVAVPAAPAPVAAAPVAPQPVGRPVPPPPIPAPPAPRPGARPAPPPMPGGAGLPPAAPPAPAGKKKDKKTPPAPPPMGFAIPGVPGSGAPTPPPMPGAPSVPAPAEKKPAPAVEGGKKGGLFHFGGKKPSAPPAPPQLDMAAEKHMLTGATALKPPMTPPVITSLEEGEWQGTVSLDTLMESTVMMDGPIRLCPSLTYRGRRVELNAFPFTIGKSGCSLNVDNPRVSRCHATIFVEDGAYFLRDEGSTNHTYLEDGTVLPPYTPYRLSGKLTVVLGNERLELEIGGAQ